ncbi:MAG: hypothetical protein JW885_08045 [Deltaproteobacteria bacterium]|nr:hypothetical protein [Candidatus Zymogenaceae bacterium]
MKKIVPVLIILALFLTSCQYAPFSYSEDRTRRDRMYYAHELADVREAAITVLEENEWKVRETKDPACITASIRSQIIGFRVALEIYFDEEGNNCWMEISKHVPMQITPGTRYEIIMMITDIFHKVELELERNY